MSPQAMKAVLQYNAPAALRAQLAAAESGDLAIRPVDVDDLQGFAREMRDADALLHVLTPVTAAVMAGAPRLRLIQKIGIGVDTIDLAAAKARGIAVCNMPGTNTASVAELTLALMLACLRRLPEVHAETARGRWLLAPPILDAFGEISGQVVGFVGYGAVPRHLTPALAALGARVIAWNRSPIESDVVQGLALDEVVGQSDILSLHLPLTDETRGILDRGRIMRMKRGAIVVNTARGALIDEAALVEALAEGRLAAAGLDVFAVEPVRPDNPLLQLPNVVLSPHVAWISRGTWRRSLEVARENCRRLAAGEPLLHRVA